MPTNCPFFSRSRGSLRAKIQKYMEKYLNGLGSAEPTLRELNVQSWLVHHEH
jgi:hypothetical protein